MVGVDQTLQFNAILNLSCPIAVLSLMYCWYWIHINPPKYLLHFQFALKVGTFYVIQVWCRRVEFHELIIYLLTNWGVLEF